MDSTDVDNSRVKGELLCPLKRRRQAGTIEKKGREGQGERNECKEEGGRKREQGFWRKRKRGRGAKGVRKF